jgi:hypothetical protein
MHKKFLCRQISFKTQKYKKILNISQKIPPFLKISKNTGTTPLLINPDNFRAAMITSPKLCLDKVIYRLGEFDNFILMLAVFASFRVEISFSTGSNGGQF